MPPHFSQMPGLIWTTSGCIGQKKIAGSFPEGISMTRGTSTDLPPANATRALPVAPSTIAGAPSRV